MSARRPLRRVYAPAAACWVVVALLSWNLEAIAGQRLHPTGFGDGFRPLSAPREDGPQPGGAGAARVPYARIRRISSGYDLAYGFRNYDGDAESVEARLGTETVADAIREYGFRQGDFQRLDEWYQSARQEAVAEAQSRYVSGQVEATSQEELEQKLAFINDFNASVQKKLDDKLAALSHEYQAKRRDIYVKGGFRFENASTVEADIPAMARRNWRRMRPVAEAFARLASRHDYEAEGVVGAVAAMVQTSLRYEVPPDTEGSRVIGGATPPPETLVLGQGDCDTKTAVIASILLNWPDIRMVGLAIPGHYLMAYNRAPRSGEVYIEYQGLPYVMIESAGPAWLAPGTVGDHTQAYLDSGADFRIQPFNI